MDFGIWLNQWIDIKSSNKSTFQCHKADEISLKLSFCTAVHKLSQTMLSVAPLPAPDPLPESGRPSTAVHFASVSANFSVVDLLILALNSVIYSSVDWRRCLLEPWALSVLAATCCCAFIQVSSHQTQQRLLIGFCFLCCVLCISITGLPWTVTKTRYLFFLRYFFCN